METIERDLTTPAGIQAELKRLAAILGGKCNISLNFWTYCGKPNIYVCLDVTASSSIARIEGDTFAEMLDKAEAAIHAYIPAQRNATIRKMALAIIELTDEHTECTRTLLRGKGFSQSDIDAYSADACARAGEMCGNAPFRVVDA